MATTREVDLAVSDPQPTRQAGRAPGGPSFVRSALRSLAKAARAEARRRGERVLRGAEPPARRLIRVVAGAWVGLDEWARRTLFGAQAAEDEKGDAGAPGTAERGPGAPADAAEARPEGFLVSRVAGEEALREAPHPLTEDRLAPPESPPPAPAPIERMGELPWAYEDDAFVALPRDPETMWLFWDFGPATLAKAREGLEDPRVRLRILEGEATVVQELDLALESRSFYVTGLSAGRSYRGELVFFARNGARRIGNPSNPVHLPPVGPSPIVDDRFATIPWGLPLGADLDLFAHGAPGPDISNLERQALRSASRPPSYLGASENAVLRGGGSLSARVLSSSPGGSRKP